MKSGIKDPGTARRPGVNSLGRRIVCSNEISTHSENYSFHNFSSLFSSSHPSLINKTFFLVEKYSHFFFLISETDIRYAIYQPVFSSTILLEYQLSSFDYS